MNASLNLENYLLGIGSNPASPSHPFLLHWKHEWAVVGIQFMMP